MHTLQFQKSIASSTTTATVWTSCEMSREKTGCAYGEYIVVGEEPTKDVNSDGCDAEEIQAEQRGWVCRLNGVRTTTRENGAVDLSEYARNTYDGLSRGRGQ